MQKGLSLLSFFILYMWLWWLSLPKFSWGKEGLTFQNDWFFSLRFSPIFKIKIIQLKPILFLSITIALLPFLDLAGEFNSCSECFLSFSPCTAGLHDTAKGSGITFPHLFVKMFKDFLPPLLHGTEKNLKKKKIAVRTCQFSQRVKKSIGWRKTRTGILQKVPYKKKMLAKVSYVTFLKSSKPVLWKGTTCATWNRTEVTLTWGWISYPSLSKA